LNGILKPCYSYLVHVPIDGSQCHNWPNFFTWGFLSHDFCFSNGRIRVSGEDHFSAFKDPMVRARCAKLAKWTRQQYGCDLIDGTNILDYNAYPQEYGVYSETPDMVPLVGSLTEDSRIFYLLGCNAWGQTILSYCSSLVPALLQYADFSPQQNENMKLLTIRRLSHLPEPFNN
jgi:glycine/D-amino acid oxidase-like deaminating enzyme